MMNFAIGIISWLPNDEPRRTVRKARFQKLIDRCNELFNLPIIVVAQDYTEEDKKLFSENCKPYYFVKLGITKARQKLRELLIQTDYDGFIFLDDDCDIRGDNEEGKKYLKQVEENIDKVGIMKTNFTALKLIYIPKEILKKHDIPNISAEQEKGYRYGFEDVCYVALLRANEEVFNFKDIQLFENTKTNFDGDEYSTWKMNKYINLMANTRFYQNGLIIKNAKEK